MDLIGSEQLEQRAEVLLEPVLMVDPELLDAVGEHSSARRKQAPQRHGGGTCVPLEDRRPVLAPISDRVLAAVNDKPSAGAQHAERAERDSAPEGVERNVHAVAGQVT